MRSKPNQSNSRGVFDLKRREEGLFFSHDKTGRCEPGAAGGPGSASCQSRTEGTKPRSREKQKLETKNILTGLLQVEAPRLPELLLSMPFQVPPGVGAAPWHPFRDPFFCKNWFEFEFCILHPKESELVLRLGNWGATKLRCLRGHSTFPLADLNQGGQAREESEPYLQLSSPELQM